MSIIDKLMFTLCILLTSGFFMNVVATASDNDYPRIIKAGNIIILISLVALVVLVIAKVWAL